MPKKRRPDSDEHLTYFFRSMDPDDNVARAADELAQASQQDPRIQEALAAVQAFLAEPIGASYLEAAARLGNDFGDFGSFAREQAPLFGAAHIGAADTLTDGRGFERFGRRVRQGQILLDRVRLALIDTDAQFQGQVLTEAVRRAERSPAFRLRLREAAHQADWLIQSRLPQVGFGEPFDAAFRENQAAGGGGTPGRASASIAGLSVLTLLIVAAD
jgi:hypothetical protein